MQKIKLNNLKKFTVFFNSITVWGVRNSALLLWVIFLTGFAVKVLAWFITPVVSRDSTLYLQMIQSVYNSGSYSGMLQEFLYHGWIPPLHICLVRTVMHCGLGVEHAGVFVNIVFASLLVPVGYGIVYSVTENKKIALVTALFFAVHPGICDLSVQVQREILYLFFAGSALLMFFFGLKKKQWYMWCGTGAFLALGLLTRYETAELILLLSVAVFVLAAVHSVSWKFALSGVAGMIAALVIVFVAFLYFIGNMIYLESCKNYFLNKFNKAAVSLIERGKK